MEPTRSEGTGEELLPDGGCGTEGVELPAAGRSGDEVCIGLGMNAEMMPDWLLTGNIWQMIEGLLTGGEDKVGGAGGVLGETLSKDGFVDVLCRCICAVGRGAQGGLFRDIVFCC